MAAERSGEDFPEEIAEQLRSFGSWVTSVDTMVDKSMSICRTQPQELNPLDQAKLDLMSVYTLNSLFWMYLVTQGVNPREHGIKQELERIRTCMNRVKEITEKKKAARLDKGAAARFLRSALYEPEEKDLRRKSASKKKSEGASHTPPPKLSKRR